MKVPPGTKLYISTNPAIIDEAIIVQDDIPKIEPITTELADFGLSDFQERLLAAADTYFTEANKSEIDIRTATVKWLRFRELLCKAVEQ